MDAAALVRGQEVLVGNRRALFLELNLFGSPIVRFVGEQRTRVVPIYKLRASQQADPERLRQRIAVSAA